MRPFFVCAEPHGVRSMEARDEALAPHAEPALSGAIPFYHRATMPSLPTR